MRISLAFIVLVLSFESWALDCSRYQHATPRPSRYVLRGAQVLDTRSHLSWQRCAVGQRFEHNHCLGSPKLMTLDEAQAAASKSAQTWRVPTIQELASLISPSCQPPMVNTTLFPDVVEMAEGKAKYWSSSPVKDMPMLTYNVDFIAGAIDANTAGIAMAVRWVRSQKMPR